MFAIAFLIGVYANSILLLGLAHLYTRPILIGFTVLYILASVIFWEKFNEDFSLSAIVHEFKSHFQTTPIFLCLLSIALGLMLLGVLAPELSFDALWYHLTQPKIYLEQQGIVFIPGGLLYYSAMPKLGELLYTAALALQSEILAKVIHSAFAILTGIAVYSLTKRYTTKYFALLATVIFFSNIVVLWEATIAYIDLIRGFFEVMAFWGMVEYLKTKQTKWFVESAFLMGLAIESKLVAVSSLMVMIVLLFLFSSKQTFLDRVKNSVFYITLAFLVPLPWFAFSYLHTGNPLYPLFSVYSIHFGQDTLAFPGILIDPITIFFSADDPISPIYLMLLPFVFSVWRRLTREKRIVLIYSLLSLIAWTLTPRTGGGRFLLPYLPVFSVAAVVIITNLQSKKLQKANMLIVFLLMLITLAYRGVATIKYLPVVFGLEAKNEFLTKHLNFNFGDFSDIDGEFKKQVKPSQTVLLYGFHNLYYLDVPYIHESWVQKGDTFDYIATQHSKLPDRFKLWQPIYTNPTTGVTLYTGGGKWIY